MTVLAKFAANTTWISTGITTLDSANFSLSLGVKITFIALSKVHQLDRLRSVRTRHSSAFYGFCQFTAASCCPPFTILTAVISASTGRIWMKLTFLDSRRNFQQNDTKIVFVVPLEVPEKRPGWARPLDSIVRNAAI